MLIAWLLFWLINGTPALSIDPPNTWTVAFIVCLVIDVVSR